MEKYALLGKKLGHSYSKIIHQMYFEMCGITAEYSLIESSETELSDCFCRFKKNGFSGINVTIPYKCDIIKFIDVISDEAKKIGAVNTVKFSENDICGYNTDYYGLIKTFEKFKIPIFDKKVVILGSGGACKAVCAACGDLGARNIVLVSRNPQKNNDFEMISYNEKIVGDVMINATPVGMYPNIGVSPISVIDSGFEAIVDLIYNPSKTCFMEIAENAGIKAVNGLYMLVSQAMRSQEIWSGKTIADEIIDKIYDNLKAKSEKGEF